MADKQTRREKVAGVIKCKPCQGGTHEDCLNKIARHVRICDCTNGVHHEREDQPAA